MFHDSQKDRVDGSLAPGFNVNGIVGHSGHRYNGRRVGPNEPRLDQSGLNEHDLEANQRLVSQLQLNSNGPDEEEVREINRHILNQP